MALTCDQRRLIRERLLRGDPVFRIAYDLGHSPHTVRKMKRKLKEESAGGSSRPQTEALAPFIPVDLRLLVQMAAEEAIDLDYQVLLPVPLEVAAQYVEIEKMFRDLSPLMDGIVEGIKKSIDGQMASGH